MPARPRAPAPLQPLDVLAFLKDHGVSAHPARYARGAVVFAQGAKANSVFYLQDGGVELLGAVVGRQGSRRRHARSWRLLRRRQPGRPASPDGHRDNRRGDDRPLAPPQARHDPNAAGTFGVLGPVHRAHAHAEYPHRRQSRRPAVQFERETAGAHAAAPGPLWQGGDVSSSHCPNCAQETLAEMVGTTRSRVNFFMNKFRKQRCMSTTAG